MQLEEELSHRKAEIQSLTAQLRGSDASSQRAGIGEAASGSGGQPQAQETGDRDASESALASCRQELDSLKVVVDSKNQEICDLKLKVQQATKENMEMMDAWKVTDRHHRPSEVVSVDCNEPQHSWPSSVANSANDNNGGVHLASPTSDVTHLM